MSKSRRSTLRSIESAIATRAGKATAHSYATGATPHRGNSLLALEAECRDRQPESRRARSRSFDTGEFIAATFAIPGADRTEVELFRRPHARAWQVDEDDDEVESFDAESTDPAVDENRLPATESPASSPAEDGEPSTVPAISDSAPDAAQSADDETDEVAVEGENVSSEKPMRLPDVDASYETDDAPGEVGEPAAASPSVSDTPASDDATSRTAPSSINQPVDAGEIDRDLEEVLRNAPPAPAEEPAAPVLTKPSPEDGGPPPESDAASGGGNPHEVFETMARSLTSNTFDMGSYDLGNRFAEIEAELDAENRQKQRPNFQQPVDRTHPVSENDMQVDIEAVSKMLEDSLAENDARPAVTAKPDTARLPKPEMPAAQPIVQKPPHTPAAPESADADGSDDAAPKHEGAAPSAEASPTDRPQEEASAPAQDGATASENGSTEAPSYQVPVVRAGETVNPLAAAAAMLLAWRDQEPVAEDDLAGGTGRWQSHRDFLNAPLDQAFLDNWGLSSAEHEALSFDDLKSRLQDAGPVILMTASDPPVIHVVSGVAEDDGSGSVHYFDPAGRNGTQFARSPFADYARRLGTATLLYMTPAGQATADDQGA